MDNSSVGLGGSLLAARRRIHTLRTPFGRFMWTRDPGQGSPVREFHTNLAVVQSDARGRVKDQRDLGSGIVQSALVMAVMQDFLGTGTNAAAPAMANLLKRMYTGTGASATAWDYQLGTTAGPASGTLTSTLSDVTTGGANGGSDSTLQLVGSITYTSSLAITEWGLFNAALQGAQYTGPASGNTVTNTTWQPSGASPGWTTNQWAGYLLVDTTAATTVAGYIISNTANVLTISPGWFKLANSGGVGTNPAATDTMKIFPLMSDHKTFSALNVVNTDVLTFTYTLQAQCGG